MSENLNVIAELLHETMTNAGWMDDPDENLHWIAEDEGVEAARKKFDEVNAGIRFINEHTDSNITEFTEEDFESWSS